MTPDNAEDEAAIGARDRERPSNISHGHKHRRGKTGRVRKKRRHWGLFSRWRTGESDDEDDIELYRWSKSRGLTARSLPPGSSPSPKLAHTHPRSKVSNDPSESKVAATQRTLNKSNNPSVKRAASADAIRSMQEAIFMTKLCASILDKKLFVNQSRPQDPEPEAKKKEPVTTVPKKQIVRSALSAHGLPAKKKTTEEKAEVAISKPSPSLPTLNKISSGSSDKSASYSPSAVCETEVNKQDSHRYTFKSASTSRKHSTTPTSSTANPLKKEWSANVESDILRLYESSSASTSSTLVCSWAAPFSVADARDDKESSSDVKRAIERKIERAEHTPSYVQALAKMFKSRMQMRKDREQQMMDEAKNPNQTENFRKEEKPTQDRSRTTVEDVEKIMIADTTAAIISQAHLRYRHIQYAERCRDPKSSTMGGRLQISQLVQVEPLQSGNVHSRRGDGVQCNQLRYENLFPASSKSKGVKARLSAREILPSSETKNFTAPNDSQENNVLQLGLDTVSEISEGIINSLATRLENEARSDDFPMYKLNMSSETAKLSRLTPSLTSTTNHLQDQKSAKDFARKAKQCLLSNTRTKLREQGPKFNSVRASCNDVPTDIIQCRKDFRVRWPTSVGSLYLRPPPRLLAKASVQKA